MPDPFKPRRSRRPRRSARSGAGRTRTATDFSVVAARTPAPQPSGANRRLLLASSLLGDFEPAKLEVQDSQLSDLTDHFRDNLEELRERIGVPPHVDVSTFLNPTTMRQIMRENNVESESRAIALHDGLFRPTKVDELVAPGVTSPVIPRPMPLHKQSREALEQAGFVSDDITPPSEEDKEGVSVGDAFKRGGRFLLSGLQKLNQALTEGVVPPESAGPIAQAAFRGLAPPGTGRLIPGQEKTGLGVGLEALDVLSETTAEALAQLPKDFRDVEAPTLFTEGYGAALDDFQSRPLKEQIGLGFLDPTIFVGGGSLARKALTNSFDALPKTRGIETLFAVEREAAEVVANEIRKSQLKHIPALPASDTFLRRVSPQLGGLSAIPGARRIAGGIDPSSQLHRLAPGSPERLSLETNLIYKNADEAGEKLTEVAMARARERYDINNIFGTSDGFDDLAIRATKVTAKEGANVPDKVNPYFGNVAERSHLYNVTAQQQEAIDFFNEFIDEAFRYFKAEGVKVERLGSTDELFHMFPRRVFNAATGKSDVKLTTTPGRPRIGQHRTQEFMRARVLSEGKRYGGPYEVLTSYLRGGYNEVARIRAERHATELFRSQKADRTLLDAKRLADNIVRIQQVSVRDINAMLRGFIPSETTVAMYKRAFPTLASSIDAVTKFKPREFTEIIRSVTEESLKEAKLTQAKFEEIIRGEARPLAKPFETRLDEFAAGAAEEAETFVPTVTIEKALALAGVEAEAAAKLGREISVQAEKLATGLREESLRALRNRMQKLHVRAQEQSRSVGQQATFAVEAARRPGQTEKFSEFFQNKIIGDFKDDQGNVLKTGREIADHLDRHLIDASGGTPIKQLAAINAGLRFTKTATDFGAPLIQGLPLLFRDPVKWGEVTKAHLVAFKDPRVRSRYIAGNSSEIVEMIEHGGMLGSSEFTEAMLNAGWLARLPINIKESSLAPGPIGTVGAGAARTIQVAAERFSNSFETFLDLARIETWKALRPMAKNAKDLDELAGFVNKMTGTTSSRALGVPLTQRQFEGAIPFFSPRYTRATAGLVLDMMRGGLRGELARNSIGRLFFGVMATHVATQTALGQDIRLDPTKSGEFMRSDIAGQRIGFGGKFFSFFKSFIKINHAALTKPEGYLSWNIFSPQDYRDNPWLSTIRNQASPLFGTGLSLAVGADPLGKRMPGLSDPVDLTKFLGQQAFPFWLDAGVEAGHFASEKPVDVLGAIAASGAEFGGAVAFEIPAYAERDALFEKYAPQDFDGKSFKELTEGPDANFGGRNERRQLLANHPDLLAAQQQAESESRDRVLSADRQFVNDEIDRFESEWLEDLRVLNNSLLTDVGSGDPRAQTRARTQFSKIGAIRKTKLDELKRNKPKVFEDKDLFFAEQAKGLDEVGNATLIAQQEFFDRLTGGITNADGSITHIISPETGRTDYIALNALRSDMDAEFGEGMMVKIDKFHQETLDDKPIAPWPREYMRSFEALRPYWESYKNVLAPDEIDDWLFFDSQPDDNQRKLLASTAAPYRDLFRKVSIERRRIQSESKDVDRMLFQIYGFRPRNREHFDELIRGLRGGP